MEISGTSVRDGGDIVVEFFRLLLHPPPCMGHGSDPFADSTAPPQLCPPPNTIHTDKGSSYLSVVVG